jgi:dienelactone hydrolase
MRVLPSGSAALVLAALVAVPACAGAAGTFNATREAKNFAITEERQAEYDTPAYQKQLTIISAKNAAAAAKTQASDRGRFFSDDLCFEEGNGCAGDIRLYNWGPEHYGLVRHVLFTARNGATLSGHVWATRRGPAHRPGVVITDGSVQADEQMYWYAAQTLAKEGYVVLTFDPQGQGQSDTFGAGPDRDEGFPAQSDGRPFYDGTEDAVNFFLSTPKHRYRPVVSCSTGTRHAAKQNRRVKAGFDAAYNPFWKMLNRSEIGLAGHSYGAAGVSYIGQWDHRVKAIVAWDNLGGPGPQSGSVPGMKGKIGEQGCPGDPADRTRAKLHTPALGISADYGLPPTPNTSQPDPKAKSVWSMRYSKAGVDTGEIIIRGGSHLDFSYIPNQAFGASLRGPDITNWYTLAWFDKYLKHSHWADRRLLSSRWRHDTVSQSVDPRHDPNAFSFYYPSRLSIHRFDGEHVLCRNLRRGCSALVQHDGVRGKFRYITIDRRKDR